MRAVLADPPNGAPALADFAEPVADGGQELIQVRAAALTNLDVANAEGRHYLTPKARPFVVGREALGVGADGRRRWWNAVSLVEPFGSMAERTLAKAGTGLPVPDEAPDALAAAVGNAGLAAWLALSWRARLQRGERVLILGATGVSGLIAVTAARRLGAGRIVAAGRDPAALARAQSLGADATVSLTQAEGLAARYREAASGEADVVIDFLNGPPAEAAIAVMAHGGRIAQIGSSAAPAMRLDAQTARKGLLDVLGFAYYHAPLALQAEAYAELCRLAVAGEIELAHETVPLADFQRAWDRQKAGGAARQVVMPG